MSKKSTCCAACGSEMEEGKQAVVIRMGDFKPSSPNGLKRSGSKTWAKMHRVCFLRSINSPTAARTLLAEGRL